MLQSSVFIRYSIFLQILFYVKCQQIILCILGSGMQLVSITKWASTSVSWVCGTQINNPASDRDQGPSYRKEGVSAFETKDQLLASNQGKFCCQPVHFWETTGTIQEARPRFANQFGSRGEPVCKPVRPYRGEPIRLSRQTSSALEVNVIVTFIQKFATLQLCDQLAITS